ncbi:putative molybdenum carrier protein [Desulfolithobacter sp.]
MKIISGGQSGADRAALDAAISLNIPHGGWLPRGRRTEEGPLPDRYRLQELPSANYRDRTRKNILDSDGTLIVSFGPLTGGSALTEALAIRHRRPCLHIDLELWHPKRAQKAIEQWLKDHNIKTLNVAGPRASGEPRIYRAVYDLLLQINWPETDKTP